MGIFIVKDLTCSYLHSFSLYSDWSNVCYTEVHAQTEICVLKLCVRKMCVLCSFIVLQI